MRGTLPPPDVLEAVLEQLAESVLICDPSGRILYVNRTFEVLTGYGREEVLGLNPRFLKSGKHPPEFYKQFWEQILAGVPFRGTFINRRKDGSLYTEEKVVTPVKDAFGKIAYLVATSRDVTEEMAMRAQLEEMATYDPLTHVLNRRAFVLRVEKDLHTSTQIYALAYFDLDHFKMINDLLGHQAGDAILAELGYRLSMALPQVVLGRIGGDEFAAWYPVKDASDAKEKGQALLEAGASEFQVGGQRVRLEGSLGIALFPEHGSTIADLLRRADLAMYRAKTFRLSSPEVFTPDLEGLTPQALALEGTFHQALSSGRAYLALQKIFNLKKGAFTDAEVLFRIASPEGLINPLPYLDLSRRSINEILDRFVLSQARGLQAKFPSLTLWVNVTPWSLADPTFVGFIMDEVGRGLRTDRLVIEVSEQLVQTQLGRIVPVLWKLRNKGIKVALDDFGSGQISLLHLQSLPIDFLKVSKELFWAHRSNKAEPSPVIRHIIKMGHELGLAVVVEGVESEEDLLLLRVLGTDLAQGFYLHSPSLDLATSN